MVMKKDMDVLIVGAGPVGLFLANECARRGLHARIIEARPSQSEHSKALAIFPRTLEIFDMAGVVQPFLEVANRVTSVAVDTRERRLAELRFEPDDTPYPFVAMVPQDVTEKLLVKELNRRGTEVEYDTKFLSAVQHDDQVSVIVACNDAVRELTASFVIGCDGAHSTVRHSLDLSFEGSVYEASFMLADVETNEVLPADQMQLCPSEFGPLAVFPMSAIRRRLVATVKEVKDDAPSLDLVKALIEQRGPKMMEIRAIHWSSYFRVHHRQVGTLRIGRIFLAGDAAHIHSPFGGQGMNTGLHDAWNLAWKLDLVARGHGGEQLLDSYSVERRPIIKRVVDTTHFMTSVMATPNKLAQTIRDIVIPVASHLPRFRHAFVQRLSQLGVIYEGSPMVVGDGKRYFDNSIRGGQNIAGRFLLLVGSDLDPSSKEAANNLYRSFSDLVELRVNGHHGIMLVRPDGYVAFSSRDLKRTSVAEQLRSCLERHTR